jgi:hypothetical protein
VIYQHDGSRPETMVPGRLDLNFMGRLDLNFMGKLDYISAQSSRLNLYRIAGTALCCSRDMATGYPLYRQSNKMLSGFCGRYSM